MYPGVDIDFTSLAQWWAAFWPEAWIWIKKFIGFIVGISIPLSLFFFIGIIYCVERTKQIRKKEEAIYDAKVEPAFEPVEDRDLASAQRWDSITTHINSENPNDWRQAILDADIILDDLLTKLGYRGETVGEKLKRVVSGDLKSLNEAWEAHKIRNNVAHEGSQFNLNHHDAKHVIQLYRKVFEEFYYI